MTCSNEPIFRGLSPFREGVSDISEEQELDESTALDDQQLDQLDDDDWGSEGEWEQQDPVGYARPSKLHLQCDRSVELLTRILLLHYRLCWHHFVVLLTMRASPPPPPPQPSSLFSKWLGVLPIEEGDVVG